MLEGFHACLSDQVSAQPLLRLHEQKVIDAICGGARDHRIRAAEGDIPGPFRQPAVMVGRIGGLMKFYFQSFIGEESFVFTHKQGWPALIASHIEHVHKLFSWSASNTFGLLEQSHAIRKIWFHRENYVTI